MHPMVQLFCRDIATQRREASGIAGPCGIWSKALPSIPAGKLGACSPLPPGTMGLRCLGASKIAWQQGKDPWEGWGSLVGGSSPNTPRFDHLSLAKPGSWQARGPASPRCWGFWDQLGSKCCPLYASVCAHAPVCVWRF